jgi:uncharacterized Zn finger protein
MAIEIENRILSEAEIRNHAGKSSFEKGKTYFNQGKVSSLINDKSKLTAKVKGSQVYTVKLWKTSNQNILNYQCSCPFGREGNFCKHLVSAGLAFLNHGAEEDTLEKDLRSLSKEELLRFLLDIANKDLSFREKLFRRVSSKTQKAIDLKILRKKFKEVFYIRDFIYYYDAKIFFEEIEKEVISVLAELLEINQAKAVFELAVYAMTLLEEASENIDDSDGEVLSVFQDLLALFHTSCEHIKPDPASLSELLFAQITDSALWESDDIKLFKEVLGEAGLKSFYDKVFAAWSSLPVLQKGQFDHSNKRASLKSLMLMKAKNVLEVLEIEQKELSSGYSYQKIVKLLKQNTKFNEALDWAFKGHQEFPDDVELMKSIAELLVRKKQNYEAASFLFKIFQSHPTIQNFIELKNYADLSDSWDLWRQKAIGSLNQQIESLNKNKAENNSSFAYPNRHLSHLNNLFIKIALRENRLEDALKLAKDLKCNDDSIWLDLARVINNLKPNESWDIFSCQIEKLINLTNTSAYKEAIKLLVEMEALFSKRKRDFSLYVECLEKRFKVKRNFINQLQQSFD